MTTNETAGRGQGPAPTSYDSSADTLRHIRRVDELLKQCVVQLLHRGTVHDASKLADPEKATFDEFTPKLKQVSYGSPEYKACTDAMDEAIQHHYAHNSHHPQHYPAGIHGMDCLDIVEMLADWKAAGERHSDGCLIRSVQINRAKFGMQEQLVEMLLNSAFRLGWADETSCGLRVGDVVREAVNGHAPDYLVARVWQARDDEPEWSLLLLGPEGCQNRPTKRYGSRAHRDWEIVKPGGRK